MSMFAPIFFFWCSFAAHRVVQWITFTVVSDEMIACWSKGHYLRRDRQDVVYGAREEPEDVSHDCIA